MRRRWPKCDADGMYEVGVAGRNRRRMRLLFPVLRHRHSGRRQGRYQLLFVVAGAAADEEEAFFRGFVFTGAATDEK